MIKNNSYRAFRYGDELKPGYMLQIEHSISSNQPDISSLITKSKEELEVMRQDSISAENKAYDIVVAAAEQWEQQAALTQLFDIALQYLRTPQVEHTNNQWEDNPHRDGEQISNRVYKMNYDIWEDTKYNRDTKESVPVAWYVSWNVYLNSPLQGHDVHLAGQRNKRYTDKAAAIKYMEGRKKAYSNLFAELSPPIPKEYRDHFMVHGTLLPGYVVEGQEVVKDTAAEVSEGGISVPENKKTSVLEQLSAAKSQKQTASFVTEHKKEVER